MSPSWAIIVAWVVGEPDVIRVVLLITVLFTCLYPGAAPS
jgi:hypothetical protein